MVYGNVMHDIAAVLLIGVCALIGIIFIKVKWRNETTELVELDENDPEYKKIAERRNALLAELFQHLAVNLNIPERAFEENCEVINLDELHTNVKISYQDIICTLQFRWETRVKIVLFSNMKLRGKTLQRSKTFFVKNNSIAAARLTKFLVRFRVKMRGENKIKIADLETGGIQLAKTLAEGMTADELKRAFITGMLEEYTLADFKHPKDGVKMYALTYAMLMKFYPRELEAELEKDEAETEKEPE